MQTIYRWISTRAHCFIMEVGGNPIGECWLQRMNLQRIVAQFPDKDLRRIDLMIGEKELWGLRLWDGGNRAPRRIRLSERESRRHFRSRNGG